MDQPRSRYIGKQPTDQYLNWDSNHHLEHKRSVVRTLLQRAENLITEEEDKNTEVDHIKKVLKANGYKTWMFNTMQPVRRKENTTTETSRRQHAIGLHYISKLSEQIARIFKSYNIPVYHKPINTLRVTEQQRQQSEGWYMTYNAQNVTNPI